MFSYETKYFLAIASTLNLNRAAKELYLSPSALSLFLSKLEKKVGVPLFVRGKDSLRLTDTGKIFLEAATQVEQVKSDFARQLQALLTENAVELRIGTSTKRGILFASMLLSEFCNTFPDCKVQLSHDFTSPVYNLVADGALDFGVVILDETRLSEYHFLPLHQDELGLYIPTNHRINQELRKQGIAPDDPIDISLCTGEDVVINGSASVESRLSLEYFKRERFSPRRITHSFPSTFWDLGQVSSPIAMFSNGSIPDTNEIVFQRLKNPPCATIGILYLKGRVLSPQDKEFLRLAENYKNQY